MLNTREIKKNFVKKIHIHGLLRRWLPLFLLLLLTNPVLVFAQTTVFINELHYDNTGTDENEGVEIAGPAGTDLTGWSIVLYNGSGGASYNTISLSGTIPDQDNGYGTLVFYQSNIQNGSPDGLALVDNSSSVKQFLSYEGSFIAADGPANGMTSTDIGVSEASSSPLGHSLQLSGTGTTYEDFTWNSPATATFGNVNNGQTFNPGGGDTAPSVNSTSPTNNATNVPVDANITINFSEDVAVIGSWFYINGSASGAHTAVVTGGPQNFTLNPDTDFSTGETVSVTVFASAVTDVDTDDPPDNMAADYGFSFSTIAATNWIINEIHADPASGIDGDANGDGTRDTYDDEFVEIVNNSSSDIAISGWTLADAVSVRHTFPAGTVVLAKCGIVIFGGGAPAGSFGNVVVQIASTGTLSLNNDGDTITLNDGSTDQVTVTYGSEGADDQSITRDPDITGSVLVKHATATGAGGALFSPGTKIDGSQFSGCPLVTTLEIFDIQGIGLASPYVGQTVTTENNVVTAIGPDGFFIQTPDARADGDIQTSDGIFVYTSTVPSVAVGDLVSVTGDVVEFNDFTEFTNSPNVTVVSSGNTLPTVVQLNATTPSPNQPQSATEMERFEGMLIQLSTGITTAPTDQYGVVMVVAKNSRAFRETGIEYPGLPGLPGLPLWDGNPEIFEMDPDRLGLPDIEMFAGTEFTAAGAMGYSFGDYQLWPNSLNITSVPTMPEAVRGRASGEVTIGSLNMLRLFQNDPSASEYQDRLTKFSQYLRNLMGAPEIVAVQEVEDINTLQDLAAKIKSDDATVDYTAYLIEGNDTGGIDVGFLVLSPVLVNAVTQLAAAELFSYDNSLLHDRPPLLLEAQFSTGKEIAVLNLHLRSMNGIDDATDGPRVRQKRHEQATSVSKMVQNIQTTTANGELVVCGDFNAFEFTDGYVDVLGQIMGTPSDGSQALIPGTDEVDPDMTNQVLSLSQSQRYSYNHDGNSQVLDHVLTSQAMAAIVTDLEYARGNSDVSTSYGSNAATPLRTSDHDGVVLFLNSSVPTAIQLSSFLALAEKDYVRLSWTTETEANNVGFNLYRSQIEDSNYVKINATMIPARGDAATGADYSYIDTPNQAGGYYYKLEDIARDGQTTFHGPTSVIYTTSVTRLDASVPIEFSLLQNYPNPFNPETHIQFALPQAEQVRITIYDLQGHLVRTIVNERKAAGMYSVVWDSRDENGIKITSGVYFYRIDAGEFTMTRKMIVMK